MSSGFSVIFKLLAEEAGLRTSASREGVERLATAGYAIARQAGLEDMYRPGPTEASAKLGDPTLPLNFVKGAPGKRLATHSRVQRPAPPTYTSTPALDGSADLGGFGLCGPGTKGKICNIRAMLVAKKHVPRETSSTTNGPSGPERKCMRSVQRLRCCRRRRSFAGLPI